MLKSTTFRSLKITLRTPGGRRKLRGQSGRVDVWAGAGAGSLPVASTVSQK